MTPSETVLLARYVKACCPQQAIDDYTPDAWHDLIGDLPAADCREAAAAVARRQPFVSPAEIRTEVRRIRTDRLAREIVPAPPHELTDEPGRYQAWTQARVRQIADGFKLPSAIAAPVGETAPPPIAELRERLGPSAIEPPERLLPPEEIARGQAAESRAQRGAAATPEPPEDDPAEDEPDEGEPAA